MQSHDACSTDHLELVLRDLRECRGLSIRALARHSGVSKSTLSRWEAGGRIPRAYELEKVLSATGASPAQRVRVFSLIDAPRGASHLDELVFGGPAGPTIALGELLRAIRRRSGFTQWHVATAVGV